VNAPPDSNAPPDPLPPEAAVRDARAGRTRRRGELPVWLLAVTNGLLAAVAYRALFTLHLAPGRSERIEDWFFEPADTSPLVVLALSGWLLFRRLARLRRLELRPGNLAVSGLLLLAALASLAWAVRAQAPDLLVPSLALQLLGAAHLLGGWRAARAVALPAAFLFFAVPVPAPLLNHLLWILQLWTAETTGALLHWMGIPALVSGDQLVLSDRVFGVIETCSGLRSIVTLSMLAVLMADAFRRSARHGLLLVACAPPLAFAINALRALALVLNPHADLAGVHEIQGVVMLLGGVALLYGLDGALARLGPRSAAAGAGDPGGSPSGRGWIRRRLAGLALPMAVCAACSACLSPWPIGVYEVRQPGQYIPETLDGWSAENLQTDWIFLGQTAFGAKLDRRYVRGAEQVDLFVGSWHHGRRYRSACSPKVAFPGSGWIVEASGTLNLLGRRADTRVLRKGTRRMLVAYTSVMDAGLAGETLRALLALEASPWRRHETPLAVRLATPFSGAESDRAEAERRLVEFAAQIAAPVQKTVAPRGLN